MMAKDDARLSKINDALTAMKSDGTLAAFHKKWFGADPAPGSSTITAMPIPKG
jgi:polar amino acid transport system substrate-binding protein